MLERTVSAELSALGWNEERVELKDFDGGRTIIRRKLVGPLEIVHRGREDLVEHYLGKEELEALCDRLAGEIGRQKQL